ncbi:probable inactive receptor kinase At2g26730 [Glycine soja]|uniref:Putative inactive receptor kinase n=2 Tax=Glycine soja TaxID=3848 RepID=A0A445I4F9_GLYSO|nr:probable inactive receptor kinase At2g26730 [Glycine soja]RZB80947.1 putative inactive receptor kinase [Glycine soja]
MEIISIWVVFVTTLFLLNMTNCVEDEVKRTLIQFLAQVSGNDGQQNSTLIWRQDSSDPCKDLWQGVYCDPQNMSIKRLLLDRLNLSGNLGVAMLCNLQPLAASLAFLSLDGNKISGVIASEIGNCKQLTHLHLSGNKLTGDIPSSLAMLNNLKSLDISNNEISGPLPNLSRISGLNMFLAQNNHLRGTIPAFDFSNFDQFNVSFNNFSGRIPKNVYGYFSADSFLGNPELCGDPLPKNCSDQFMFLSETQAKEESKGPSKQQILMYSGYAALGVIIVLFVVLKLCRREKGIEALKNGIGATDGGGIEKHSNVSSEYKDEVSRSEFSVASESRMVSQSLIVLSRPAAIELKLEDLLRAPAELIGRGKNGSLYKVILDNGIMVVVKRIKDWTISSQDFKQRMQILSQAKDPHVLSPLAFYCSKQEKLLVYEYQQNGSLFKLLHGTPKTFDWTSRLGIAATIAEALSFMHQELGHHGIVHGNLKSSNILLNKNMEPCISEYGVMGMDDQRGSIFASPIDAGALDIFKEDVYGFGVILLELLTGKLVKGNGIDLTDWVQSVVREEWTGEVFDKSLISEYASEERMVNLLQVAIRCVNRSPQARPGMNQIALMINTIKEDEEKSLIYEL